MIKFLHLRHKKFSGQILTRGGITAAYELMGNNIKVAFAFCSPKDNYCRAIGRSIAGGRLLKGRPVHYIPHEDGEKPEASIIRFYDKELAHYGGLV